MLQVLPFIFCGPLIFVIRAYQNVTLPHTKQAGPYSLPLIHSNLQPFFDKHGIRKDLFLMNMPRFSASASGTNYFTSGSAFILMDKRLYDIDPDAALSGLKHEVCHILHNDNVTRWLVPAISSTAIAIFSLFSYSLPLRALLTYVTTVVSYCIFARYTEQRAINFAITHSTDDELLGDKRFLLVHQRDAIGLRTTFWMKVFMTPKGESRFFDIHPPIMSRINLIELEMTKRGTSFDSTLESKKIDKLVSLLFK